jgi:hypothetical protein
VFDMSSNGNGGTNLGELEILDIYKEKYLTVRSLAEGVFRTALQFKIASLFKIVASDKKNIQDSRVIFSGEKKLKPL